MRVEVVPWPSYDERGSVWWQVRLIGRYRATLSWCSTEGRWAKTGDLIRARRGMPILFAQAEGVARAAVGPTDNRTEIAKSVLQIAHRVLENVKAGRIYPQGTVEWAEQIVRANTPPPTSRANGDGRATRLRARFSAEAGL